MGNLSSSTTSCLQAEGGSPLAVLQAPAPVPSAEATTELCQILIKKSSGDNVGENISQRIFMRYFGSEKSDDFARLLYEHLCQSGPITDGKDSGTHITGPAFVGFVDSVRNLVTESLQLKFYATLFSSNQQSLTRLELELFFRTCFLLESDLVGSKYDCDSDSPLIVSVLEALSLSCVMGEKSCSVEFLQSWLRKNCPNMVPTSVHRWLMRRVGNTLPFMNDSNPSIHSSSSGGGVSSGGTGGVNAYRKAKLGAGTSASLGSLNSHHMEGNEDLLHPVLTWLFANTLPDLYTKPRQPNLPFPIKSAGHFLYDPHQVLNTLMKFTTGLEWERLYSSTENGLSMNRLQHHVFSYRGPTAMLIKTDGDVMLCVAIDQEWRERVSRWGGEKCMVIQVTPCFRIFEAGEKLMYFNLTTRGYPYGLHVGKNPKSPVVEIDQDLCIAKVKKIPYKLELLEVWGCSDVEVKEAQLKQKKWENNQAERHKKVNINAVDWKENPDRIILEMAGRPSYGKHFKT